MEADLSHGLQHNVIDCDTQRHFCLDNGATAQCELY